MNNALDRIAEKLNLSHPWPAIMSGRQEAQSTRDKVEAILSSHSMVPPDAAFVVFGSLARDEWTVNSDVDWTLLIDGQAHPQHIKVAQRIAGRLKEARLQEPGPTGTFGRMAFSHGLIHNIGGEEDSNVNTTQRVLLLLESKALGNADAYRRVVSGVLNRYLDDDISFLSASGTKYKVPRFLLNDIVRYWRTMCVDYAGKHRERQGLGWAIRNAKLRMSRKLIFVSGLLTCYSCYLEDPPGVATLFDQVRTLEMEPLLAHLVRFVDRTPLEIVADALDRYARPETAAKLLGAYNDFLVLLQDGEARQRLKELPSREARTDRTFGRVRAISNDFQGALTSFFFDEDPKVAELTRKYGMF